VDFDVGIERDVPDVPSTNSFEGSSTGEQAGLPAKPFRDNQFRFSGFKFLNDPPANKPGLCKAIASNQLIVSIPRTYGKVRDRLSM
jgi:hypothetical protein